MRTTRIVVGLAVLLLSTCHARAEPLPSPITLAEVTVRSGPSSEFYPTTRLHFGDAVRVVGQEASGWLAIVPPPGSFSWIHTSLVEQIGPHAAVVLAPEAQIWVGSRLVNFKPTVWRTKAMKGTQLTVIGRAEVAQDGPWLPILPVPAEVRYIPAEAIAPRAAPQQSVAPSEPPTGPARFSSPRSEDSSVASVPPSSSIQGSAAQPSASNAQALQDQRASGVTASPTVFPTAANNSPAGDDFAAQPYRSGSVPGGAVPPPQRLRAASEYCYLQDAGHTARLSPPIASAPNPPPPTEQWSELGWLRRTAIPTSDRPLYCLEPLDPHKRLIYVAAGDNVDLEPYINRNVYLCGRMVYRGDLRTYYMTVVRVSVAH